MVNVKSTVGRSWPAHDLHFKVGDNLFPELSVLARGFIQAYVEAGLMSIDEDAGPAAAESTSDSATTASGGDSGTASGGETSSAPATDKSTKKK